MITGFASGVLAVTKDWIRNGFSVEPDVLARIIYELMPLKMQAFFSGNKTSVMQTTSLQ